MNQEKTGHADHSSDNPDRDMVDQQKDEAGGFVEQRPINFTYASGSSPLNGFTIKRGIGVGGFGEVYFAISDGGKEVALKKIQRHLDIEMRGMRQCLNLKHENLLCLFDIRHDDQETGWVVMEYVSGKNLKEQLDENPEGFPHDFAAAWIHCITSGVAHLHRHGIVHRDLKPANIFMDDGRVKVGDYGLSKFISCSRQGGQTESVGTFHYMAPEIGKGNYGKQVDVYALGIMLFEILTGDVPFDGESSQEIIMKHLTDEPDLAGINSRFRLAISKSLEKNPDKRFRDAAELLEALPEPDWTRLKGIIRAPEQSAPEPPAPKPPVAEPPVAKPPVAEPPVAEPPGPSGAKTWIDVARLDLQATPPGDRLTQLLGSMLKASLVSTLLTLIMLPAGGIPIDGQPGTMSFIGWLITTHISCCWMVLVLGHLWESREGDNTIRRLVMFIGGVATGALAFMTADYMNLSLADFHSVGGSVQWPWMAEDGLLTLGHYAINYGIVFVVFCWWKQAESFRPLRIDMLNAVACGFVAWLLPIVPLPWGFMMAATISITIQTSAPFISKEDRQRYEILARRNH